MESFEAYALSSNLTEDEKYTVELLIDRVRHEFDPNYLDHQSERRAAREKPDYVPSYDPAHVQPAAEKLRHLKWLSFQRTNKSQRPVRDLTAVRYLPRVATVVLSNNEVSDLSPLSEVSTLIELVLQGNMIQDLSSLASCQKLRRLNLDGIPAHDISVLASLPALQELTISVDQVPALRALDQLVELTTLEFMSGSFDSFVGFPDMPLLRRIRGASVRSLDGIQCFSKLQNLINFSGEVSSLGPLLGLKELTHANFHSAKVDSLEPLASSFALRDLWLDTSAESIDLAPLERLPVLHDVTVKCAAGDVKGLASLRAQLLPWDVEFRSKVPRHTPSLELVVVDQSTFHYYDGVAPYNLAPADRNSELLASELDWLDEQLSEVLSVDYVADEDYSVPHPWPGARSRTIVLLSERAVEAFAVLVLGLQKVLAYVEKDWILYLQTDGAEKEFAVWVYPDKIMVSNEHEGVVRELLQPKKWPRWLRWR